MDMGDIKSNNGFFLVGVVYQVAYYRRIIKVIETFVCSRLRSARMLVITVVAAKFVFCQQGVDAFTTLATKMLVLNNKICCKTIVPAMITGCFFCCRSFGHR